MTQLLCDTNCVTQFVCVRVSASEGVFCSPGTVPALLFLPSTKIFAATLSRKVEERKSPHSSHTAWPHRAEIRPRGSPRSAGQSRRDCRKPRNCCGSNAAAAKHFPIDDLERRPPFCKHTQLAIIHHFHLGEPLFALTSKFGTSNKSGIDRRAERINS